METKEQVYLGVQDIEFPYIDDSFLGVASSLRVPPTMGGLCTMACIRLGVGCHLPHPIMARGGPWVFSP